MATNNATRPKKILILGVPRSGTTWLGEILSLGDGVEYIFEPDNEKTSILAFCLKSNLLRFPHLRPGDKSADYEKLWKIIFSAKRSAFFSKSWFTRALSGMNRNLLEKSILNKEKRLIAQGTADAEKQNTAKSGHSILECLVGAKNGRLPKKVRLVKSVHGVLASEWIAQTAGIEKIIVMTRNPYGVLASLRRMKMPDALREACLSSNLLESTFGNSLQGIRADTPLSKMALQTAIMYKHLESALRRNANWIGVRHEDMLPDPVKSFRDLYARLGLDWSDSVETGIMERNREGGGYKANRVAAREIGKWRKDFTASNMAEIKKVFEACDLSSWLND